MDQATARRRRHRPGPGARLAGRLPVHEGARRAAPCTTTYGGDVPISIVRPSIIESALAEPRPGWIRGFRMAEPIIVSYARGLLREFPGVPEGVIDVIPVDMVVAAIVAVAAHGPEPGGPSVVQVASGVRNPLRYGRLVQLVQEWFGEHPVYDDRGQPISVPEWSFPGRGRVQRQLQRATKAMDAVERLTTALPVPAGRPRWRPGWRTATRWPSGPSATSSCTARTPRPRPATGSTSCSTLGLPRSGRPGGVLLRPGRHRLGPVRARRPPPVGRRARPGPDDAGAVRGRQAAGPGPQGHPLPRPPPRGLRPRAHADGVERRRHLRLAGQPPPVGRQAGPLRRRPAPRGAAAARPRPPRPRRLPPLVLPPLRGRAGRPARRGTWELFHQQLLTRSFPAGLARVREHRRLGHRTLLVTGALDFVIAPLRPLFDDIVCARLGQHDGRYDGRLEDLPTDRRSPSPPARRLHGGSPICPSTSPSPTPTPRATWRCSKPSASRRGQPGVPARRHRPAARLARRALGEGVRRLAPPAADRPARHRPARWPGRGRPLGRRRLRHRLGGRLPYY